MLLDNQSYYELPNGMYVKDITKFLSFDTGNVVKYNGRAGRKHKDKEKEDLGKVLTYLAYLLEDNYITSPFLDKLEGIRKLLKGRGKSENEIEQTIVSIKEEFTSNIDSMVGGLQSESRKQVLLWIYNFLVNKSESAQKECLENAIKYIQKAILEVK